MTVPCGVLLGIEPSVAVSVHLDAQLRFRAIEVEDVPFKRVLAAEVLAKLVIP
jgi:hypothetical protein